MSEKERSKIQNRVDASREQSGAAGLIERSSTDENTINKDTFTWKH